MIVAANPQMEHQGNLSGRKKGLVEEDPISEAKKEIAEPNDSTTTNTGAETLNKKTIVATFSRTPSTPTALQI